MILTRRNISILEIVILITAVFAFSYIFYQSYGEDNKIKQEAKSERLGILISFFKAWLERSKLGIVAAEQQTQTYDYKVFGGFSWEQADQIATQCCPKLKNNVTCQDVARATCSDSCAVACIPSSCDKTAECQLGCCIDASEGTCSANVPKGSCSNWKDDKACNVPECKLGCCIIGDETQFVTEQRCKKLSSFYGLTPNFMASVNTEVACISLSASLERGACVYDIAGEKSCRIATKQECSALTTKQNSFYPGYLCSNPQLNTSCVRQTKTGCVDGKDEVYWYDSCNNAENIYDSNKDKSWNSGLILSKAESCSPGSSNANSKTCGNCDYFLGSICSNASGAVYGNYMCSDLNCKNAPANVGTQDRRNGEAWCVYDGFIGDGKDIVGSRHWKYYCVNGKVKVEPCGDFRNGICVQSEIDSGGGKFSNAACRLNQALECVSYNADTESSDDELSEKCQENSDCILKHMDFGKEYEFDVCTPKYPIGFDMKDNAETAESICHQANFECTKVEEKTYTGWKCIAGCDCDSVKFTQQMNDYCKSLGDCGGNVNVLGHLDKGYKVKIDGKTTTKIDIDLNQYSKYTEPVAGQFADPGDFSDAFESAYGFGFSGSDAYVPESYTTALGLGAAGVSLLGGGLGWSAIGVASWGAVGAVAAAFSGALVGAGIGAGVGLMVASLLGLQGQGALGLTIAGAAAGIGLGMVASASTIASAVYSTATITASAAYTAAFEAAIQAGATVAAAESAGVAAFAATSWIPVVGWIVAALAVIFAVVTILMGVGEVEETTVNFYCEPYEPPSKGKECGKCMQDELTSGGLKKCSKYRCQSLGQSCTFINAGTGYEACIDNSANDILAPEIYPWASYITAGYNYSNVSKKGFAIFGENESCIPEFTAVNFGILTSEPSQCRYDLNHTSKYDEMQYDFGSTLYKINHTMSFFMPSTESLISELDDGLTEEQIANLQGVISQIKGKFNIYVRCKDYNGNWNNAEFAIKTCVREGADLTPQTIVKSAPLADSYLAFNQNETNLTIWINEPADCKYDSLPLYYNDMRGNFSCKQGLNDVELYGWPCIARLTNLSLENNVSIRCKDQPWLENTTNVSKRNINAEARMIRILKSDSPLNITSIKPNETIFGVQEPLTAKLEVTTEGGVNGRAVCSYSFTNSSFIQMSNTGNLSHSTEWNLLFRGYYKVDVKCVDIAGNTALGFTNFEVAADTSSPSVTRVYKSGTSLKLFTNENGVCKYSFIGCQFDWNNSSSFSGSEKEHTAGWDSKNIYYIKCKDNYNNEPAGCSIIVKPEELI